MKVLKLLWRLLKSIIFPIRLEEILKLLKYYSEILKYFFLVFEYFDGLESYKGPWNLAKVLLLLPFIISHIEKVHEIGKERMTISHILGSIGLNPSSTVFRDTLIKTLNKFISRSGREIENCDFLEIREISIPIRKQCIKCSKKYPDKDLKEFPRCKHCSRKLIVKKVDDKIVCSSCGKCHSEIELKVKGYPSCECGGLITFQSRVPIISFKDNMISQIMRDESLSSIIKIPLSIINKQCLLCEKTENYTLLKHSKY